MRKKFLDLGIHPLANSFLSKKEFARGDLPKSQKETSFASQKRQIKGFKWAPYFEEWEG